ncbi:hypothetical protein [Actinocrispum wychmicini]|uniref:Uncharacterized protein n=1 Tax=Actinocrispum wychmicini TaxID=1213861 RepID=A0A4R2JBR3_9PSEU|nr:hypothetical protein [Actinocrispum wychmicini]TCO55827.1 hypothetical protein EV192_107250 [Actinocrispum wychmicini]
MSERLGHKQTAAMFWLMTLAREVSNPELDKIAGFRLTGTAREDLNERHLVASHKQGRCYVHELTDQGWVWCGEELATRTAPPPRAHSTLVPVLYVVVGDMVTYLRRKNMPLADVFMPDTGPAEVDTAEVEDRIRAAYRELASSPRDWVGLVDLRPKLADLSREAVDAVLKALSRSGQVHLVPEANRKTLARADHDAAIRLGGEDNHLISIEVS